MTAYVIPVKKTIPAFIAQPTYQTTKRLALFASKKGTYWKPSEKGAFTKAHVTKVRKASVKAIVNNLNFTTTRTSCSF